MNNLGVYRIWQSALSVQMPDMDGFAATQAIREKERAGNAHVPIVALTAHAMKGDRERCRAAGMDRIFRSTSMEF